MAKEKATFLPLTPDQFAEKLTQLLGEQSGESLPSWERYRPSSLQNVPSVQDGLQAIEHDWENVEWAAGEGFMKCKLTGIQSLGPLTYLGVTAGGDWETPVFSIFYFDMSGVLRAYIPEKGNVFNFIAKAAFGNNEDTDTKAAMMGWRCRYADIESFKDASLSEDIRLHFGIKKGAVSGPTI